MEAQKKVAVIGGGPAGLASCRLLEEMGHSAVVFEKGMEVGGIWAPEPTNPVVYEGLTTNIPKYCMQTPELDFPQEMTSYVSAAELGEYIRSYCDAFKLRDRIRFGTTVTKVSPQCSEEEEAKGKSSWSVSWQASATSAASAVEESSSFDAVVVATGHYEVPFTPAIAGQEEWLAAADGAERRIVHSVTYNKPSEHAGKSVLVVGSRSSGMDIARELKETARCVYVLDKGCQKVHQEANCIQLPRDAKLQENGMLALSGEAVQGDPVDTVILATGYEYSFPFLDLQEIGLRLGETRRSVEPLYMHIMHARRPSLNFIGIPLAVPTPILLFEGQARFVASQLKQLQSSLEQREAWVGKQVEAVTDTPQALHVLGDTAWEHMLELVDLSGLQGDDLEAYMRHFNIIRSIYGDIKTKRPKVPWGDDSYRKCEYTVDWKAGTWDVVDPKIIAA